MTEKQEKRTRVKVKRMQIRGDEVAILFFSLVFLVFLFISFFRLFAVGKLLDDFFFTFLFGWSKYLVYLFLVVIMLPIFFNSYFKIKFSFVAGMFFTFFMLSWFVQNITILVNYSGDDLWTQLHIYEFEDLSAYFNTWWASTIINHYHGFFGQPISFADWTNVSSFFPSFATGGIVANSLVYLTSYGTYITSLVLSATFLFIGFSWVIFAKPWLLLMILFIFMVPIINYCKKKNINRISEKSSEHKTMLDQQEAKVIKQIKQPTKVVQKVKKPEIKVEPVKSFAKKDSQKEKSLQDVVHESGTLTPFGQFKSNKIEKQEN